MEVTVEQALVELLRQGGRFDYAAVRELAAPAKPTVPQLVTPVAPDLRVYDALLTEVAQ